MPGCGGVRREAPVLRRGVADVVLPKVKILFVHGEKVLWALDLLLDGPLVHSRGVLWRPACGYSGDWSAAPYDWCAWHFAINGKLEQIRRIILAMDAVIKVIGKKCQGDADNQGNEKKYNQQR